MNRHLKILLVLIEPPLPFGNAGSRWFYVLLKELEKRGHKVHILVASGVEKDIEKAHQEFSNYKMDIFPFAKAKGIFDRIKNITHPHSYKFSKKFKKAFKALDPDSFDIIHVEQTWGGWVTREFTEKTLLNIHYLQSIDLAYAEPNSRWEKFLFRRYFAAEKNLISNFPFVRTCTPRLEEPIRKWGRKSFVETVPFGIDSSLYSFIPREQRQSKEMIVSLIGNMGWYPSSSAAERLLKNVWPKIKKELPQARCQIVGWKARQTLKDYLKLPDVEILENVPDIQPYFNNASVLVYPPQRGSGMKIKVQEAFCFGIPVVTTSEGIEGLPTVSGIHCGVAEDNQGLAQWAVKILKDNDLAETLRQNGRKLIEEYCSPQKTVTEILTLYKKMQDSFR